MTNSMDTRPLLTAEHMGLAVGDSVRLNRDGRDWCGIDGLFGRIEEIRSWYSAYPGPRIQLVAVRPDNPMRERFVITGVTNVTKISPTIQYDWSIGPEDEVTTHEVDMESRQQEEMEARMLGFESPESPGYREAQIAHDAQYEVRNEFPVGSRILVYGFERKVIGQGTVAGHRPGLTEDGDPESGPGAVYLTDMIIVLMDDGSVKFVTEGDVDNRECKECGGLVMSKYVHNGIENTTLYACSNCDWKDMA